MEKSNNSELKRNVLPNLLITSPPNRMFRFDVYLFCICLVTINRLHFVI